MYKLLLFVCLFCCLQTASGQKPVVGTVRVNNAWGPATTVVNGQIYKVPVGVTDIAVPAGKFTIQILEASEEVKEYAVDAGGVAEYKLYNSGELPANAVTPILNPTQWYQPGGGSRFRGLRR
jgi:hypothetical protein